jgi:hypothetical protein
MMPIRGNDVDFERMYTIRTMASPAGILGELKHPATATRHTFTRG